MSSSTAQNMEKNKAFGALTTNLSKAFYHIDHERHIAKLNAYEFILPALKFVHNYLSNRKQRKKVNSSYSERFEIVFRILKSSNLGPLLNNIVLADLLFIVDGIVVASYGDDTRTINER